MNLQEIILLILIVAATSIVGVVTGSNSLITVPAMFQLGIEPKVAIATNMFGLTFMNIGASIPFFQRGEMQVKRLSPLIMITLVSSGIGALLVGWLRSETIPLIVVISMVLVSLFIVVRRVPEKETIPNVSTQSKALTYVLTFLLGIYGGVFSGGYVTMLTVVLVAFYGFSIVESIAGTKLINVFSSGIATLIFASQGLIDYRIGLILAATMFLGAYMGARIAVRIREVWLKRIFLASVVFLAFKTLFDYAF